MFRPPLPPPPPRPAPPPPATRPPLALAPPRGARVSNPGRPPVPLLSTPHACASPVRRAARHNARCARSPAPPRLRFWRERNSLARVSFWEATRCSSSVVAYSSCQHARGGTHAQRRSPRRRRVSFQLFPTAASTCSQGNSGTTGTRPSNAASSTKLPTRVCASEAGVMARSARPAARSTFEGERMSQPRRAPQCNSVAASRSARGCHQPCARSTARRCQAPWRSAARCTMYTAGSPLKVPNGRGSSSSVYGGVGSRASAAAAASMEARDCGRCASRGSKCV